MENHPVAAPREWSARRAERFLNKCARNMARGGRCPDFAFEISGFPKIVPSRTGRK
jgi:hypothetical protein